MVRPVGNGVIRGGKFCLRPRQSDTLTNRSYRTPRDGFLNAAFPGILCLATIIGVPTGQYTPAPYVDAHGTLQVGHGPTNERWYFDKTGKEGINEFAQVVVMKQRFRTLASVLTSRQEIGRIYVAVVLSGAAILLMMLAEMKFFGT